VRVEVVDGDFHHALKEFTRLYQYSGLQREVRLRRHFVPRPKARKLKAIRAARRAKKKV
jgi:ribosomal protein S21